MIPVLLQTEQKDNKIRCLCMTIVMASCHVASFFRKLGLKTSWCTPNMHLHDQDKPCGGKTN